MVADINVTDNDHSKVLMTIDLKKEERKRQFLRAEIVRASRVPGHVVDVVLKSLLADGRIAKVGYHTYEWTLFMPDAEERAARLEPMIDYLKRNNASTE